MIEGATTWDDFAAKEKRMAEMYLVISCNVKGCEAEAITGRILCEGHAYPAEQKVSGRRQAIMAQKKAKADRLAAEEDGT